jgi:hypothetical protein
MITILAYWIFLFAMFLPAGLLVKKTFKLNSDNLYLLLLLGMFLQTVCFTVAAFFFPLNGYVLLVVSIATIFTGFILRHQAILLLKKAYHSLISLPVILKVIILTLFTGVLLKSAQSPFVIDNESYYMQTIKWLNEYGFVKGLGNLHIFLAQTSAWHVLQAGLNFSFFTDRINDINGFVFMICTLYYFTESQKHLNQNKLHWIGLLPVFSVLLFLFTDSPSPDLPLLMVTPVILYLFSECPEGEDDSIKIAVLLFIFLVFIKITIAPLALLFLPFLYRTKKHIASFTIVGFTTAALWIAKNIIISGYPLYPFEYFKTGVDWAIPYELVENIGDLTTKHGYYKGNGIEGTDTLPERLSHWIQLPGLAGLLNKTVILLFVGVLFFKKIWQDNRYRILYFALLCHFAALLFTSPQFRFFLPEIMFFSVFILAEIYNRFNYRISLHYITLSVTTLCIVALFLNVSTASLTKNKFHQSTPPVRIAQLYLPERNSRFSDIDFVIRKEGNLEYFSPKENFFFFGTANGPLPCLNEVQLQHYKKKFGYIPQLRGNNLQDGFYSLNTGKD